MWIGIALFIVLFSIIVMLLIARKWNIYNRSTFLSVIIIALTMAIPYLWIYNSMSGWQLIIAVFSQIGLTLMIALALVFYHFSRDPERKPPQEKGVIVSPADGEVIDIKLLPNGITPIVTKKGHEYYLSELAGIKIANDGMIVVSIEMNILNVHVNRSPIAGQVKLIKHIRGQYVSLRNKEAPFINARCMTLIMNEVMNVAIVQIASRLVRRVENYLHQGQTVVLGQRLGMIRFGSQVVAIIPNREDIKLQVHIGQKVLAGTSIIALYNEKSSGFLLLDNNPG